MTEKEIVERLKKVKDVKDLRKISQTETELYRRAAEKINSKYALEGTSLKKSSDRSAFVMNDNVKKTFPKLHATMARKMVKKGKQEAIDEQEEEKKRKRQKIFKG